MTATTLEAIESAIRDDRVTTLAAVLGRLYGGGRLGDESLFAPVCHDHYARRLLWRHPQGRFVVVAMTWAPGQGAPLHDHAGTWGAEIVTAGTIVETPYELRERSGTRCRFEPRPQRLSGPGSVGVVTPPLEHHTIANAGDTVAHTLHVYAGDLTASNCYTPVANGWYEERTTELRYDG